MAVTIALRFPLGRYHATPWDRTVNEGEVEWPPSPWRLLRALVSTWHLRARQDVPEEDLDGMLRALSVAPSYSLPLAGKGHTRHYMPDKDRRSGETGNTDLVLDPFLAVDPAAELVVHWPEVSLSGPHTAALTALVERLPYLGRSESVCEGRVTDDAAVATAQGWWYPAQSGQESTTRLLSSTDGNRASLEVGINAVRRNKRLVPEGSHWVDYVAPQAPAAAEIQAPAVPQVQVIRWRLSTSAPFMARYGVLATDRLRSGVLRTVRRDVEPAQPPPWLSGKSADGKACDDHKHAHWLWVEETNEVRDLVLWVPDGLTQEYLPIVLKHQKLSGPPDWTPEGFRPGDLHLVGVGGRDLLPNESVGTSTTWVSSTPYLPNRHRKRETVEEFLTADVSRELQHRGLSELTALEVLDDGPAARRHRRQRMNPHGRRWNAGFSVRITMAANVAGPLCLGGLSHFGFGQFRAEG